MGILNHYGEPDPFFPEEEHGKSPGLEFFELKKENAQLREALAWAIERGDFAADIGMHGNENYLKVKSMLVKGIK